MKQHLPLAFLLLSLFLAPLLGGQVYLGARPALDGFLAGIRGPELPFTGHAIVATLAGIALIIASFRHRVIQLPSPKLLFPLGLLLTVMGFSVSISSFRWISWVHWLEWLAYGLVFVASIAILGRDRGPRFALWSLVAGTTLVAIEGILEYADARTTDPTWRIFSSFVNPNALAGMLLMILPIAFALVVAEEDRLMKLLAGSASVLIGLALLLTQSRAGILSFGVGLVALVGILAFLRAGKRTVILLIPIAFLGLMLFGLQRPSATSGGAPTAAALSRVGDVASTSEQSGGYRILLWRGAIDMMQANPFGYGVGTYRYESARSGRTPQTQFTHQGFLQLGVESGILSLLLWLGFLGIWIGTTSRGVRDLSEPRRLLLAGVFASVAASSAHNLFDSDWQHFGIGFAFLALLGIGIQLAADGSSPEHVFKPTRVAGLAFGTVLGILALWHSAFVENLKSAALGSLARGDVESAQRQLQSARSLAPGDGEPSWIEAGLLPPDERETALSEAAAKMPSTRHLRMLARTYQEAGKTDVAEQALRLALDRDPNNLPTLLILATISNATGNQDEARDWLNRLIAVEQSSYWKVRAIPELIPTETFEGRIMLADLTENAEKRRELLLAAVEGLTQYAEITAPRVKLMSDSGGRDFAGESKDEATRKIELAESALSTLRALYREAGDRPEVLETLATRLSAAAGAFGAP